VNESCRELYSNRLKAAHHLSLHHFFKRVESCQSTGGARDPIQPCAAHLPASSESSD
jgi:hypothetical protein